MDIFRNFKPNGEFEKHAKMIEDLKTSIRQTLINMNFTAYEQGEVISVIDDTYKKIREISEGLVGSNINNNPKKQTEKAMKDIDKLIKALPKEIKKKMDYLIEIKKDNGTI